MRNIFAFAICLFVPLLIGGISGIATASGVNDWFLTLNKPSFNPPNYLFGPVWTTLYLLMGVSLYFVWRSPISATRTAALRIFVIQISLNFAWSFLFFYFHWIGLAFAEIVLIWVCILLMIFRFYPIHKTAALLQIPYLLWVSFASVLNGAYFFIN